MCATRTAPGGSSFRLLDHCTEAAAPGPVGAVYGNKRELLRQLIESAIADDDSPAVADMLRGDYGWSSERFEKWLARMMLATVIGGPSSS